MNMSETQDRKKPVSVYSRSSKGRAALSQQSDNQGPTMRAKKKGKGLKDKKKAFRSSLHTSVTGTDVSGTSEP